MSTDLQSALQLVQINNYASLVVIVAVIHDYFLVFPKEVKYIWCKPWSWVSTMYVLARYVGLSWAIIGSLCGTTFIPGPLKTYVPKLSRASCTILFLVNFWELEIYLDIADLLMILRVYAMWDRSRGVLWALLCFYVPQIIIGVILAGIFDNPNTYLVVAVVQILDFSSCVFLSSNNIPPTLDTYSEVPRLVLGTVLLLLAVSQTIKQSVELYRATKQWQPNQYIRLFTRDGIIYFLVNVLIAAVTIIQNGSGSNTLAVLALDVIGYIALCNMTPRFVISVRELYDHDIHRSREVDTGFGVLSQPIASQNGELSAIAFADTPAEQEQVEGNTNESEAIQMEPRALP